MIKDVIQDAGEQPKNRYLDESGRVLRIGAGGVSFSCHIDAFTCPEGPRCPTIRLFWRLSHVGMITC